MRIKNIIDELIVEYQNTQHKKPRIITLGIETKKEFEKELKGKNYFINFQSEPRLELHYKGIPIEEFSTRNFYLRIE